MDILWITFSAMGFLCAALALFLANQRPDLTRLKRSIADLQADVAELHAEFVKQRKASYAAAARAAKIPPIPLLPDDSIDHELQALLDLQNATAPRGV